jgi:diguanylate cyclase (GGDEF)-like protein
MRQKIGRHFNHLLQSAKTVLVGPQILAFIPALTLGGYWFGGEGVLLFMAIIIPAMLGLVSFFTPVSPSRAAIGPVDPITTLPLRETLITALDHAFCREPETGLRTAAIALEIDGFSQYQDQFGAVAADSILLQVGQRIKGALREGDIAVRSEGAMFAVALAPAQRIDLESMIQIAARLQSAITKPLILDGLRIFLTASVGFCIPRRASEKSGLICLESAESALADAQGSGLGAIRAYSPQPRRKKIQRAGLVGEVAQALECGQIKPWFQPQLSTDTGEISGMEALARWEHPDRGVILPGAFLPGIAAAGLNERLSEIILFHSLTAMQKWARAKHLVPQVGVNFSGDELSNPHLCEKIRWELDRFDLAPSQLSIEVLETVIARSDNDMITRNIARLAELGCGIDLDDFGTGHASIANIRRFSVRRIKIDRSFVINVDTDRQQQQMLTAILEMAERLGVETLAEGVETAGEHTLLAQLGCGHVQGYNIAKPMCFADTLDWMKTYRAKLIEQTKIRRKTG